MIDLKPINFVYNGQVEPTDFYMDSDNRVCRKIVTEVLAGRNPDAMVPLWVEKFIKDGRKVSFINADLVSGIVDFYQAL